MFIGTTVTLEQMERVYDEEIERLEILVSNLKNGNLDENPVSTFIKTFVSKKEAVSLLPRYISIMQQQRDAIIKLAKIEQTTLKEFEDNGISKRDLWILCFDKATELLSTGILDN